LGHGDLPLPLDDGVLPALWLPVAFFVSAETRWSHQDILLTPVTVPPKHASRRSLDHILFRSPCLRRTSISSSRCSSLCCRRNRRYFTLHLQELQPLPNGAPRDPSPDHSPSSPTPITPPNSHPALLALLLYLPRPRLRRDKSKHPPQIESWTRVARRCGRSGRRDTTTRRQMTVHVAKHRSRQGVRGGTRIRRGRRAFVWWAGESYRLSIKKNCLEVSVKTICMQSYSGIIRKRVIFVRRNQQSNAINLPDCRYISNRISFYRA
jgi:hypothetical protein